MRQWWWAVLLWVVASVAACSDAGSPATTPAVPTPPETSTSMPATTTTAAPPTTSTTPPPTTEAPTTTVDRLAEVQAIIQDLEERRLDALFREDEHAFRALFANDAYLELSLELLGNVEFVAEPRDVIVEVREILADTGECLAIGSFSDLSQYLGPEAVGDSIEVLERREDGQWGYSYVGTGWLCDGPHPLES